LFSKNVDALPIISTSLEYQPCAIAGETSTTPLEKDYALERDRNNSCSAMLPTDEKDKTTREQQMMNDMYRYDKRY
jgi:hypothetical protein